MRHVDSVSTYLRALAALCLEVAANRALLPSFTRILKLFAVTVRELRQRDQRRLAL